MAVRVERVSAPETFDLRRRVLRPHQRLEEMTLQGDEDPDTAFYVARDATSGNVLATASVQREAPPWEPQARRDRDHAGPDGSLEVPPQARFAAGNEGANAWRLRAMATAVGFRGQGLGRRVLDAVIDHVSTAGGGLLWCGARIRAVQFYERAGFSAVGDFYKEPIVGIHVLMWRVVAASTT
ncbi:MAG: GNAT family N-acetyltransferase [Acidimicrobiales bacterium]